MRAIFEHDYIPQDVPEDTMAKLGNAIAKQFVEKLAKPAAEEAYQLLCKHIQNKPEGKLLSAEYLDINEAYIKRALTQQFADIITVIADQRTMR